MGQKNESKFYSTDTSICTKKTKSESLANTIQIDAMYQLLVQKEYFTEVEFLVKMKEVQADYKSN